jgi:peptidoglycan/xylan/chitin deacetylase (PgdA/CDA1 family)
MLHSVSDAFKVSLKNWCITQNSFLQLLDFLEENKIQTTHFAGIIRDKGERQSSFKKLILTFDDCPKHLFDFAIPELVKRKMKAVFYMPTANIGGYNSWDVEKGTARLELMNETDLKELARHGMEVGSHSHHHIDLKNVSDIGQLQKEITVSKQIIESITGKPVYSFAYPYGSVPAGYQTLLSGAGYQYAVSIYQPYETALALRRFGIYDKDTKETLARKISVGYKWSRKLYDKIKRN